MRIYLIILFCVLLFTNCKNRNSPLPIIDMYLHAVQVNFAAMPNDNMCAPFAHLSARDPKESGEFYTNNILKLKTGESCEHTIYPFKTNDETLEKTLAIMEKLNINGVVSGTPELMSEWMEANEDRFWPGMLLTITPEGANSRKY